MNGHSVGTEDGPERCHIQNPVKPHLEHRSIRRFDLATNLVLHRGRRTQRMDRLPPQLCEQVLQRFRLWVLTQPTHLTPMSRLSRLSRMKER